MNFLNDPMITLELIAILMSICYLASLSMPSLTRRYAKTSQVLLQSEAGFFNVGSFISTPKKSLPQQRTIRSLSPQ